MMSDIAAILSGALVGGFLSLVGGGGSLLAVPLLLFAVGVPSTHVAIGTSAVAVTINAFASLTAHARAGNVRWLCAGVFALAGTAGALIGSNIGRSLDGDMLLFAFGLVMIGVAAFMTRAGPASPPGNVHAPDLRMCLIAGAAAVIAGLASGLFGIGGGFLIVPAMILATRLPMINAIGSSLLAVGTFGMATAVTYASAGLIDWKLAAEFVSGGLIGSVAGMLLASRLASRNALTRIFASVVFAAAAYTLYRSGVALFS